MACPFRLETACHPSMALYFNNVLQLLRARLDGVSFRSTVSISRLNLFLEKGEVTALARALAGTVAEPAVHVLQRLRFGDYADDFLRAALGCEELESMDFSDYEGASILHDLNQPIPASLAGRWDAVIDAGTFEHVFHVGTAVANSLQLVKTGGAWFAFPPANGMCGHGFYQFSPDFFFRALSNENGFRVDEVFLIEAEGLDVHGLKNRRRMYRVIDPAESKIHPLFLPQAAVCLLVKATKLRQSEPWQAPVQQSMYLGAWEDAVAAGAGKTEPADGPLATSSLRDRLRPLWHRMPQPWRLAWSRFQFRRQNSLANRRAFVPLRPLDLLKSDSF